MLADKFRQKCAKKLLKLRPIFLITRAKKNLDIPFANPFHFHYLQPPFFSIPHTNKNTYLQKKYKMCICSSVKELLSDPQKKNLCTVHTLCIFDTQKLAHTPIRQSYVFLIFFLSFLQKNGS